MPIFPQASSDATICGRNLEQLQPWLDVLLRRVLRCEMKKII